MVHQSGVPVRDRSSWYNVSRWFAVWFSPPRDPFNQRATFSPPPVIVTTAMVRSTTLGATVTIGLLQPTIATTVTTSTSIRATGTGTTTIGLTASRFGPSRQLQRPDVQSSSHLLNNAPYGDLRAADTRRPLSGLLRCQKI